MDSLLRRLSHLKTQVTCKARVSNVKMQSQDFLAMSVYNCWYAKPQKKSQWKQFVFMEQSFKV